MVRLVRTLFLWLLLATCMPTTSRGATVRCGEYPSSIDAAICEGGDAKRNDDEMVRSFYAWFNIQDKAGKARELKDQRSWLADRKRACSRVVDIGACVAKMSSDRSMVLYQRAQKQGDLLKHPIRLGDHEIVFSRERTADGLTQLVVKENGATVMTAEGVSETVSTRSGQVVLRHTFGATEAIVVAIEQGGTLECSENYVLWHDPAGQFRSIDFGNSCVKVDGDSGVEVVRDGFASRTTPTPAVKGSETVWVAGADTLRTRPLAFAPTAGTTMQYFSANEEPLRNADFYRAVSEQTGADKERFFAALWGSVTDDYEVQDETAGVGKIDVDSSHVYVGGCGQRFNGTVLACGADDFAMAYYDRTMKRFYFAIRNIDFSPKHITGKLRTHPELDRWDPAAKASLAAWTKQYDGYERGTTLP